MHKKIPKICSGCRVIEAKIYLYDNTKIAKARPHCEEWQTDTSVQKQWSMAKTISDLNFGLGTVYKVGCHLLVEGKNIEKESQETV